MPKKDKHLVVLPKATSPDDINNQARGRSRSKRRGASGSRSRSPSTGPSRSSTINVIGSPSKDGPMAKANSRRNSMSDIHETHKTESDETSGQAKDSLDGPTSTAISTKPCPIRKKSLPAVFPSAQHQNDHVSPGAITMPNGQTRIVPDLNVYQHKKTLAQGMMDLALLSANANQLRYVLESSERHPYYHFTISFIVASLIFQVLVGIGLVLNSRYNCNKKEEICKADRINNLITIAIFLVTIINVFISAFGVAEA